MALRDVALLVVSVAVAVCYATYCITTGRGILWDVEEEKEEREEKQNERI